MRVYKRSSNLNGTMSQPLDEDDESIACGAATLFGSSAERGGRGDKKALSAGELARRRGNVSRPACSECRCRSDGN